MSEPNWTSAELLERCQNGDESAATEVFDRYVARLTQLARTRLSSRFKRRTDPEDVVLSAWRSFFVGARAGKFSLQRSGDLWRLLVSITLHKLYHQTRRQSAERRSVDSEQPLKTPNDDWLKIVAREPSPDDAAAFADQLESIFKQLDELGRRVLELRLQGHRLEEIAAQTGRSERTVRRTLSTIRERLSARMSRDADE